MLEGWKPVTLHMWPESEANAGERNQVRLQNGAVEIRISQLPLDH